MLNKKIYHIAYVGRLEKEKGIEILRDIILYSQDHNYQIVWHIFGDGSYYEELSVIPSEHIHIYGHLSKDILSSYLKDIDIILMPSLFLETFGLVALEVLSLGKPVIGFRQGGLKDFIDPGLALEPISPVDSFFEIIKRGIFPLVDTSKYSYETWLINLAEMTKAYQKILLVNDYITPIGGAETYVFELKKSLEELGKTVQLYGYNHTISRLKRILLMIGAPLAFWRKKPLQTCILSYQPDLIWMHSVGRYIGPFGLAAISESSSDKYVTHHDLGLISLRPSQIYHESDIPLGPSLGEWVPKNINILALFIALYKWMYIRWIWSFLSKENTMHFVPSTWMIPYFEKYTSSPIKVHPHTIFSPSKK